MENFNGIKNIALGALAAAGAVIAQALGGWDGTLKALLAFMAADYVTGLRVAAVVRRSPKTERGALSTGSGIIRAGVCLFFTANEGLSILENLGLMGVPYPGFLRDMLEAMRKKNDDDVEGEG